MNLRARIGFASVLAIAAGTASAAPPTLVELSSGERNVQGRVFASDDSACWLLERDGRLEQLQLSNVTGYRTVEPRYQAFKGWQMKPALQAEFGDQYEITEKGRYIVCAPQGQARAYASILDEVDSNFERYFSRRGLSLDKPEFPLVAVVFGTRSEFVNYCNKDDIQPAENLLGYYHCESNRIALYDPSTEPTALGPKPQRNSFADRFARPGRDLRLAISRDRYYPRLGSGDVATNLRDTIVHEGTHQLAFNMGLHPRIGDRAMWVVEGLATSFEPAGVFDGGRNASRTQRVNRGRFAQLLESGARLQRPWVEDFVGSNQLFGDSVLDAYAMAWGLTFYLIETNPSDYVRFMRSTAARDPLKPYPAAERVADFKKVFGSNTKIFESNFRDFVSELSSEMSKTTASRKMD